uniref:SprT-like domain-containing protein n=1 Tax=Haemonchus placei TaxID=6290 RepID=A0A158QQ23_HAEPC
LTGKMMHPSYRDPNLIFHMERKFCRLLREKCCLNDIVSGGKTLNQRKETAKAPHACNDDFYNEGCHSDLLEHSELNGSDDAAFSPAVKQGKIPEFLPVKWNNRLYKTAGMCRNMSDRTSWIELSPKVCSTPDRVRDTLIHELCHAAVWVVDGKRKEGHGPLWKKWAAQCMQRFPFLPVIGRCHDYEIDAKFIYECGGCGQKVRRHTKSLNIDQKICGICKCRFTLQVRTRKKKDAVGNESSELNPFAKFVKENYGKHKGPGVKHGEVMRILAQLYKEKSATKDDIGDTNEQVSHDMSITESTEPLDMSILSIHD